MISIETYTLTKNYTDKKVDTSTAIAVEQAVEQAVDLAKEYTDQQLAIASWNVQICQTLPPLAEVDFHTVYFIPMSGNEQNNSYYEYIYLQDTGWELIGSTEFKPNDYMTKQEVMDYVNDHKYILPAATETELGGVMIDTGSIVLKNTGKISVSAIENNSILNLFS